MVRGFSKLMGLLHRKWQSVGKSPRRTSLREYTWTAAEVAECLEPRLLLTAVPGNDTPVIFNAPAGWNGPQTENPSVAMSSDGSKVVMVVADNSFPNPGTNINNTVRVVEYTNSGMTLTPVRNYVLESAMNLTPRGLVAMNGAGTQYAVTWSGADGFIRGASVQFNGPIVVAPMDLVAPTNTSGTRSYTVTPVVPDSIAMRNDGTFVEAWDTTMTDTNNPGVSTREAQAQVFNINLTAASPIIPQLNTGSAWGPVLAWTNHANNSNWEVAWTGERPSSFGGNPPTFQYGDGIWLQQYNFSGGNNTFVNETQVVPYDAQLGYQFYSHFSLTDDPARDVGFISQWSNQAPANIWIYSPNLQPYPGLPSPILTYNPIDSATQTFGTIAFDAPNGGAFQHVLVGTQRYAEGPGANWGYMQVSTGTWLYSGYINQNAGSPNDVQDMFPDGVMNSQGNWWVFARQFDVSNPQTTGWMIRAWDPPIGPSSDPASSLPTAGALGNADKFASTQHYFNFQSGYVDIWVSADGEFTSGENYSDRAHGFRRAAR